MQPTAVQSARQRHNQLKRWRGPNDPAVAQARRALELAKTEATIARAIETAPPLDAETVAKLHSLIPPAPAPDVGEAA